MQRLTQNTNAVFNPANKSEKTKMLGQTNMYFDAFFVANVIFKLSIFVEYFYPQIYNVFNNMQVSRLSHIF